ncbi:MAG: alpha/beta hydrolase fold domain-containing protein [Cryomorphaceae bacterium]|nr:alpha/beta hydrolase fold domain-containing protein [Cryomorphaceae bacterium]
MVRFATFLFVLLLSAGGYGQGNVYIEELDIPYYDALSNDALNAYKIERCVLDIYYPATIKDFATVVWFHGGGLSGGEKEIPADLREKGVCVVAVNYRLYPKVKAPAYIEDAAAAVAWVFNHIESYGGDASSVFLSGHSAGGYLVSMVGLDKSWLGKHNIDADRIAGLITFSGHTITHFTVREERGIKGTQPIVDDLAPLYHVRPDAPPLLLLTGDRSLELLGRYEENAYFMRMMLVCGHPETVLYELQGYGHNIIAPGIPLLLKEVDRIRQKDDKK